MKTPSQPAVALATLLLVACAPVFAASPINQTHGLDPRGRVEVENLKGSIEVRAWDRPQVRIEGSLGDGVERLEVESDGKRLRVKVKYPSRSGLRNLTGREKTGPTVLRLMVPLRADLALSAVSADITAWGIAPSSLKIENVSGDTTVAGAPEDVEVNSVSGNVDLTVNRGNLRAESVSGDIRISGRLGEEVDVESVSGDIDMRVLDSAVRRLEGQSVSGDMNLQMALAPRARVRLESVSGDIELRLPRATSAEVRAESFSGTLRALGATVERPRHGPGSSLRQRYGDGDADVSIETFSGDAGLRFD